MAQLMKPSDRPIEELTFREAMDELDGIVSKLEGNDLQLEESLAFYERGVKLLRALQSRLGTAQQQVDQLMGQLTNSEDDAVRDSTLS